MKTGSLLILIALLLCTCKEAYNPPFTSPNTGYLVVEGFINCGNGATTITLTRTTKLVDTVAVVYENGAQVNIEEDNGILYPLYAKGNGTYVSDTLGLNSANKYRLHITTANNSEYVSDYAPAKYTPAVDSISWQLENGGVQLYVNSHDDAGSSKYYGIKFSETWEFFSNYIKRLEYVKDPQTHEIIGVTPRPYPDTAIYRCWKTRNPSNILLASTEKLSENRVYLPIRYIVQGKEEISVLYYIEVKQYALSRDGYLFTQKLKKNTEQLGSIFDAQPSELGGNIHNVSNPAEPVIGYVDVTTEQVGTLFINHNQLSNWPVLMSCTEKKIENQPGKHNPDLIPIDAAEYRGPAIASYYAADPVCVDCTLRGTNIKPPFWP